MKQSEVIAILVRQCKEAGSQHEWALRNGVSCQYVNDVVKGRRNPGDAILTALGLEKIVTYRRKKP